jgi:hypothetical protein
MERGTIHVPIVLLTIGEGQAPAAIELAMKPSTCLDLDLDLTDSDLLTRRRKF